MVTEQMARAIVALCKEPYVKKFFVPYGKANDEILERLGGEELRDRVFIYPRWEPKLLYGKEIWRECRLTIEARAIDCAVSIGTIMDADIIGDNLKLILDWDDVLIIKIK